MEVERETSQKNVQEYKQQDQKLVESLRNEANEARHDAERLEKDYATAAEERDRAKNELEEMKRMYSNLEKRMKAGNCRKESYLMLLQSLIFCICSRANCTKSPVNWNYWLIWKMGLLSVFVFYIK